MQFVTDINQEPQLLKSVREKETNTENKLIA